MKILDRLGREVRVGDRVLVIDVDHGLLATLAGEELELVRSMRGDILTVMDIADAGYVVVEKQRTLEDGLILSQSVSLVSKEIEKQT